MQAAFATLGDYDVVVLTDGDGTYPAGSAGSWSRRCSVARPTWSSGPVSQQPVQAR